MIRLEQYYGLIYMGLQIQSVVDLRLLEGKTINSEKNTRRFGSTSSSSTMTSRKNHK